METSKHPVTGFITAQFEDGRVAYRANEDVRLYAASGEDWFTVGARLLGLINADAGDSVPLLSIHIAIDEDGYYGTATASVVGDDD